MIHGIDKIASTTLRSVDGADNRDRCVSVNTAESPDSLESPHCCQPSAQPTCRGNPEIPMTRRGTGKVQARHGTRAQRFGCACRGAEWHRIGSRAHRFTSDTLRHTVTARVKPIIQPPPAAR